MERRSALGTDRGYERGPRELGERRRRRRVGRARLGRIQAAVAERAVLFDEELDRNDPWQFKNFRVN